MSVLSNNILAGSSGQGGGAGYEIERSLRFNSADSSYLDRTPSSAGNRKTWTWSGWIKKTGMGTQSFVFASLPSNIDNYVQLYFSGDNLYFNSKTSGNAFTTTSTNAKFRDPSAWFHVVIAIDTTATGNSGKDRLKIYINGSLLGDSDYAADGRASIAVDSELRINSTVSHQIGKQGDYTNTFANIYLADIHFIDGQALSASDFGEYDSNSVWQPKEYSGTYVTAKIPGASSPHVYVSRAAGVGTVANVNGSGMFTSGYINGEAGSIRLEFDTPVSNITSLTFKGGGYSVNAVFGIKVNGIVTHSGLTTNSSYAVRTETISSTNISSFEIFSADDGWALGELVFNSSAAPGTPSLGTDATGANSFHLDFSDNSSNTALGFDSSSTGLNRIETGNVSNGVPVLGSMNFPNNGANAVHLRDNNTSTSAADGGGLNTSTNMGYDFLIPYKVRKIETIGDSSGNGVTYSSVFNIQYSDDGITWTTVTGSNTTHPITAGSGQVDETTIDDNGAHRYWRIYYSSSSTIGGNIWIASLNMFADDIGANNWFVNNLQASGAFANAIAVDGNDKVAFPSVTIGTGDFTVECFFNQTGSTSGVQRIFSHTYGDSGDVFVIRLIDGGISMYLGSNYYSNSTVLSGWHHAAIVRSGSTVSWYLDGTRRGTATNSGNITFANVNVGWGNSSEYFIGEAHGCRITKEALYSGASYTVPTSAITTTSQGATASNVVHLSATTSTVTTNSGTTANGTASGDPTAVVGYPFGDPAGIDALRDSPVNGDSANDTGAGGEITGNYATLNPLAKGSGTTLSNGNLDAVAVSAWTWAKATIEVTSGKWYWEITKVNAGANNLFTGIAKTTFSNFAYDLYHGNSASYDLYGYTSYSGNKEGQGSSTSYGAIFQTAGDIIGVALDMDAGTITFYKNGASQGQAYSGITGQVSPAWGGTTSVSQAHMNFGQRAFAYTAPSGYKALCTANLSDPTIADGSTYFKTILRSGGGTTQTPGFSPDLVWEKRRDSSSSSYIFDRVRGDDHYLSSNLTTAEGSGYSNWFTFDSNGYTVGASNDWPGSASVVDWAWDGGSSNTTIAAGGLNSSVYNQGSTNYTTSQVTGADYSWTHGTTNGMFDGLKNTIRAAGSGNTFTWTTSIALTTLRLMVHKEGGTTTINITDSDGQRNIASLFPTTTNGQVGNGTIPFVNVPVNGTLTKIEVNADPSGAGYQAGIAMVEIDGKILVDSGVTPPSVPSIASTLRANPSAGFSIVTYTGTGSSATVGHSLNVAPAIYIIKSRSGSTNWQVSTTVIDGSHDYLILNSTIAKQDSGRAAPTSSVFSIGSGSDLNGSGSTYVAYCFAPVEGYSAFGSYTGNGSADGPFVFLGFRPALVVCKKSSGTGTWFVLDSARDPYNVTTNFLEWNDADAEASSQPRLDFLSNGFKLRAPSGYTPNETSGDTYIYLAWAEHPFKNSRAR